MSFLVFIVFIRTFNIEIGGLETLTVFISELSF